jgi:AAA domain
VNLPAIPEALRARRQWVVWKLEVRDGKPTKVPYNPRTRGKARSNTPSTWGAYAEAVETWQRRSGEFEGVGFMFAADDPYTGIDLDQCIAEDGTLKEWAKPIVALLDSYAERSPSGRGLHLFVEGTLPEESRHKVPCGDGHVEAYDRVRFFTMTGDVWDAREIAGRQTEIEDVVRLWLGVREAEQQQPRTASVPVDLDDRALLDKMFASKKGVELERLYRGDLADIPRKDNGDPDFSIADARLMEALIWWTDRDAPRAQRLFSMSGLMREKWQRADYQEKTTALALRGKGSGYQPRAPREGPSDADAPPERGTDWIALHESERIENEARRRFEAGLTNGKHGIQKGLPELHKVSDLLKRELPAQQWIVPQLIPQGVSCLFGRSKMGKSWLALAIALGVAAGGKVLGTIAVEARGVLYLALEDTERRLQNRLRKLLGTSDPPDDFYYRTEFPRFGPKYHGEVILRELRLLHPNIEVVVVDTLAKLRMPPSGRGSAYDQDYESTDPFKSLADELGLSLILLHHQSKATRDDWVDTMNASSGLSGAVDTLLLLNRKRGEDAATLNVTGRDVDSEDYHIEWDAQTFTWTMRGKAEDFEREERREAVYAVLDRIGGPAKQDQIGQGIGKSRARTYEIIQALVNAGDLMSIGSGFYAKPTLA